MSESYQPETNGIGDYLSLQQLKNCEWRGSHTRADLDATGHTIFHAIEGAPELAALLDSSRDLEEHLFFATAQRRLHERDPFSIETDSVSTFGLLRTSSYLLSSRA